MSQDTDADDGDKSKRIFAISPIGKLAEDGADFTKIFLDHIVKPAADAAGFEKVPV